MQTEIEKPFWFTEYCFYYITKLWICTVKLSVLLLSNTKWRIISPAPSALPEQRPVLPGYG